MAFYRNFETVGDVLRDYFEPKINLLFDDVILQTPVNQKMFAISNFFREFDTTMMLSIDRHFEFIIRQIFFNNMQRFYQSLEGIDKTPQVNRKYWIGFMSAGVYNIWRDWVMNDKQDSLDDIHNLLRKLHSTTFNSLLES